jgi:hypothetical protein
VQQEHPSAASQRAPAERPRDRLLFVLVRLLPSIEGDFWYGHHYEMFRMADTFRRMIHTRKEPVPHREILEVTAILHAGAKSLKEKSRLVALSEMMG